MRGKDKVLNQDDRETKSLQWLETTPFFAAAPREGLRFLAGGCHVRQAQRAQVLCDRGQRLEGFHVLLRGQVKLALLSADGGERVLDILQPPQTFGESAAFLGQACALHAEALSEVDLLFVEVQRLRAAIRTWPEFADLMLTLVAERTHKLTLDLEACCLHSAAQRVAALLLREAQHEAGAPDRAVLELPASKVLIASSLNLTPETFSRELHGLARRGLIEVDRRVIKIPSLARLRQSGGPAMADIGTPDPAGVARGLPRTSKGARPAQRSHGRSRLSDRGHASLLNAHESRSG